MDFWGPVFLLVVFGLPLLGCVALLVAAAAWLSGPKRATEAALPSVPAEVEGRVRALLHDGDRGQAVGFVRDALDLGPAEANRVVERIEWRRPAVVR